LQNINDAPDYILQSYSPSGPADFFHRLHCRSDYLIGLVTTQAQGWCKTDYVTLWHGASDYAALKHRDSNCWADFFGGNKQFTAMGSDQAHKNELHPGCLERADIYVPDRRSQTEELGELHHALADGLVSPESEFPELGEFIADKMKGRKSAESITICDLTGTGVQDTAIATLARQSADKSGAGTDFNN